MFEIRKIREAIDRLETLEKQLEEARSSFRRLMLEQVPAPKQSTATAPMPNITMDGGTAAEVVLEILRSHSIKGKMARTDVRVAARRHRLTPRSVGQALRHLERTKVVKIDNDLITLR